MYTWVAIDADTKLVPCWRIGGRNAWHVQHFMYDLAARFANRVQLTTDGHRVYLHAVEQALGNDIDYAMLVKLYGSDRGEGEARYGRPSLSVAAASQSLATLIRTISPLAMPNDKT